MDKNLPHTIEDFAFNDDFIKWVQSSFQYQNDQWSAFQSDEKHQENIAEAIQLVQAISFEKVDYSEDRKNQLWSQIDENAKELDDSNIPQKSNSGTAKIIKYLIPLAASFLALIYFSNRGTGLSSFETSIAQLENISLPDGSTIDINALSSIRYNTKEYKNQRTIKLEGEAFFDVEKGKTFKVETVHGTIEVLGTSFNIHSRLEGFEVSCHSGKVKVESSDKLSTVILEAGQKCILNEDGKLTRMDGGEKDNKWISGVHYFEETPLENVMKEFQRHFGLEINMDDKLRSLEYNGSFETKDIDDAIYTICWPLKLNCELIDGVLQLTE